MSEPFAAADRRIVVGFDGSPAARAAVSLALHHVGTDGRLIIVAAFKSAADRYGEPNLQSSLDAALARLRKQVEHLPEEVPGLDAVDWGYEIVAGSAANAILRVAEVEHATEIVIGTRGVGRGRGLLGSVAHDVLHHAECPVYVVPRRAVSAREGERAPA